MQGRARAVADSIMFSLGIAGAAWEIFRDHSRNYYIYALIFALLRVGQGALDVAAKIFSNKPGGEGRP